MCKAKYLATFSNINWSFLLHFVIRVWSYLLFMDSLRCFSLLLLLRDLRRPLKRDIVITKGFQENNQITSIMTLTADKYEKKRQRSCTWNQEISFWTFWMWTICTARMWRCPWCRWEAWRRSWWEAEDWGLKETRCWTGHSCCSSGPRWEQKVIVSPDVWELRLP